MISCSQFDYIEIACMFKLPILLKLADGSVIEGIAFDTGYNQDKQEVIIIKINESLTKIPTSSLLSMTAQIDNPHLSHVEFNQ